MKTSYIYVMLLSALVVQISSETSDLEKMLSRILSNSIELAAEPFEHLIIPVSMKQDAEHYLKEFSRKLKRFMEQTQEEVLNMIPEGEREKKEKLIGYMSMYMSGAFSNAKKFVTTTSNKSFETLPDNIKTIILDIGDNINAFLKGVKFDLYGSKTSQKTPEE